MKKYVFIVSIVLIAACKNNNTVKRDVTKKINPATIVITDSVANYLLTVHNEISTQTEVNEKEFFTNSITDMELLYHISKDSLTNKLITITFNKIHIYIKNQDKEEDLDATTGGASFNPTERMISALKGSKLVIKLDKQGNTLNVQGLDSISKKIRKVIQDNSPETKAAIEQQINQFIGENFIKENISSMFNFLPNYQIVVGDSWVKKQQQTTGGYQFNTSSTFTFSDLSKEGIATITQVSDIENANNDNTLSTNSASQKVTLSGQQKGTIKLDVRTGLIANNKTDLSISGTINAKNKKYPITISANKTISLKRQ